MANLQQPARPRPASGDSWVIASDSTGATGCPMIEYPSAAVNAVDCSGAPHDPRYIGTTIWDFGDHVSWKA